jgi:hypothetical protein
VSSPEAKTCGVYSEDTQIRTPDNGGSARGYQAIFVPSAACQCPAPNKSARPDAATCAGLFVWQTILVGRAAKSGSRP